jgi:hypothetical protein
MHHVFFILIIFVLDQASFFQSRPEEPVGVVHSRRRRNNIKNVKKDGKIVLNRQHPVQDSLSVTKSFSHSNFEIHTKSLAI